MDALLPSYIVSFAHHFYFVPSKITQAWSKLAHQYFIFTSFCAD